MKHRLLKGLLATAAAVALTGTPALAAPVDPTAYAAVGDSYAYGLGLPTARAYPAQLVNGPKKVTLLAMPTGATTSSVLVQVAQIPATATQVTVTVGGNDVGFVDVATACAVSQTACEAAIGAAAGAIGNLPINVASVAVAVAGKAPEATVYVTGYPYLFQPSGDPVSGFTCTALPGYDAGAMAAFDQATGMVNSAIAGGAAGAGATYVDVTAAFAGHGLCQGDKSWTQGLTDPAPLHPTSQGQRAYARTVEAAGFNQ